MTRSTETAPTPAERARIRALASRWAEVAALPIMAERKRAWTALHDLEPERPMVLFEVGTVADYVREDELTCTQPVLRAVEATMLEHLRHFDEVGDDIVFEPYYRLGWDIDHSGWGVEVVQIPAPPVADGSSIGYTFNFPIRRPEDVAQLQPREFVVDRAGTTAKSALLEDTFGDILPVKVGNYDHFMTDEGAESWAGNYFIGLTWQIYRFIGNDGLLSWVYEAPEAIHTLMEYMTQDRLRQFGYLEAEGLIVPNTDTMLAGPRAYGYCSDLPSPDAAPGRLHDLWCWAESQETTPISPAMFAEFVLPYLRRVTERFGLVYYGCCEPLTDRLELVIAALPNLRSVSVTPWADFARTAEMLGDRYVFSRKPDPVPISGTSPHWERAEADLRRTSEVAQANDCNVELLFRDVYDVGGDRARLAEWTRLARKVFGI
jgi:hypothetical protein